MFFFLFFFKQKTAYEMRISDCSSDLCSSDLVLVEFFATRCAITFFAHDALQFEDATIRLSEPERIVARHGQRLNIDSMLGLYRQATADEIVHVVLEILRMSCIHLDMDVFTGTLWQPDRVLRTKRLAIDQRLSFFDVDWSKMANAGNDIATRIVGDLDYTVPVVTPAHIAGNGSRHINHSRAHACSRYVFKDEVLAEQYLFWLQLVILIRSGSS